MNDDDVIRAALDADDRLKRADELLTRIRALSSLPKPWITNLGAAAGGCCLTVGTIEALLHGAAWLWMAAAGLLLLGLVAVLLSGPVCARRFERRRVATVRAWRAETSSRGAPR